MTPRRKETVASGGSRSLQMEIGRKRRLTRSILRWYARNGRKLPWRAERNPYRVLVSEIMLQQTQVSRVLQKYPLFLRLFPTFSSLSKAKPGAVIRAWQGMGYNNRAIRLHQLSQTVVERYKGRLPSSIEELESLPGIGKYTAHAIACFATNKPVPVVDTNIRRVLGRMYPKHSKAMDVWELAQRALPGTRTYDWNQALMDLGATICVSSSPKCSLCPVRVTCPSAFIVKTNVAKRVNREPSRDGIPHRIYRGRIVEALRQLPPKRSLTIAKLGPRIKQSFSQQDKGWLHVLLQRLEMDGLVKTKTESRTLSVSLPT
jgi:A/G-specific adenine glycosylase